MELSTSNIKKFLTFSPKKLLKKFENSEKVYYISGNETF